MIVYCILYIYAILLYDFGVATLKVLKKLLFLNLQPTQSYLAHISKQTYDKFWWRTQISRSKMSQGTTPANYRDTVGTDNDYFLRSKKANEHTGSTGLDPKSILFSPLPRLRMPVLQSPFNSITQRTPTQQPPEQQPQQLQQPGQQPKLQPDPQLPGHQPQIQQQQLPIQQQKPVHYSNYKSMGHVHSNLSKVKIRVRWRSGLCLFNIALSWNTQNTKQPPVFRSSSQTISRYDRSVIFTAQCG